MKKIIRGRFLILAVWLIVTILLTVIQPDVNAILRNRGQTPLGKESASVMATSILNQMDKSKGATDLIVFYSERGFTDTQKTQIGAGIDAIEKVSDSLGISNILDPIRNTDYASYLISKDGTTMMVTMKLDKGNREVDDIAATLNEKLGKIDTTYYFTGEDFISNDYLKEAMSGVDRSAILTVIFILVILMLMFRSVITPFISLIAVAFSYLCSMGIAAQLIDKAGFPVTSLTQMLLILILFGIGTDYNILLFNRFKEELSHGKSVDDAIVDSYRTAGKTILFSIMTVFIAFLSLIFSKSPIYQSGVVVVIGAAILILEILTLTPFFMKTFGTKLFWPSKTQNGHKESKFWAKTTGISTKHPILSVVVVLLLILPTIIFNGQKLSSDALSQLSASDSSVKGFRLISEHFGEGQSMPSTLVIKSSAAMDNNASLAVIDELTQRIKGVDGVANVVSVTEPEGKKVDNFYVSNQMTSVTDGISKAEGGVSTISSGLDEASSKLGSADFSKVGDLVSGTASLESGVSAISTALSQVQTGLAGNSANAQSVTSGITAIESNLKTMSAGIATLQDNYEKMQLGYKDMGAYYQQMASGLLGIKSTLMQMQATVTALGSSYSGSATDVNYQTLAGTLNALIKNLESFTPEGINTLNQNYNGLTSGFATANASLTQMQSGLDQMAIGLDNINQGVTKTADGVGVIVTNMSSIETGLSKMKTGQQQLADGLNSFGTFGDKLKDVTGGLTQISDGLKSANDFLKQYNTSTTFYVPNEAFQTADFQKLLNSFMTQDRTITKVTIVLKDNPYSLEAQDTLQKINTTVDHVVAGSILKDAEVGISGTTATASDMTHILSTDLNRMIVIVLIGIFIILVILTRSIWEPIAIILSLLGSYYVATFVTNRIFLHVFGLDGIQSFVPFFTFIIIVALGVDYSIFLMMRYKECSNLSHKEAIITASKNIGGVVMSAVIILGGTFATLIPSGVAILVQLGVAIIIGLAVLCLVMLPFFLPAMIALPGVLSKRKK